MGLMKLLVWTASGMFLPLAELFANSGYEVDVKVVSYHDPGYFKVEHRGIPMEMNFYYESFQFDDLWKQDSSFPQIGKVSITERGQYLVLSSGLEGVVLGSEIADEFLSDCYRDNQTTMGMMVCADRHLGMLRGIRQGLVTYLTDRKDLMGHQVRDSFEQLIASHEVATASFADLLIAVDDDQNLGSAFRYESLGLLATQTRAQITQLEFVFENFR